MKERLKKYLIKHKILKILVEVFIKRKDELYIETVSELMYNPNILCFEEGTYKEQTTLCVIQAGEKSDGFFACVRWALDGLYFCDHFGIKPIVKFAEDGLYVDDKMPKNQNSFEYYFKPTSEYSEEDAKKHLTVKYCSWNRMLAERLNGGVNYKVSTLYIDEMSKIMSKYLQFNNTTEECVEGMIKKMSVNNSILGIHIRGTDYKGNYKNHPICSCPDDYYPFIDGAIARYGFSKIYVATDDNDFLDEFLKHYGDEKIIYVKENSRGNGHAGIHTTTQVGKYNLGLEVICDMCLLAACGGIVSGMSQVALCARIYKKSKNESYLYDKLIDKGINNSGKKFKI